LVAETGARGHSRAVRGDRGRGVPAETAAHRFVGALAPAPGVGAGARGPAPGPTGPQDHRHFHRAGARLRAHGRDRGPVPGAAGALPGAGDPVRAGGAVGLAHRAVGRRQRGAGPGAGRCAVGEARRRGVRVSEEPELTAQAGEDGPAARRNSGEAEVAPELPELESDEELAAALEALLLVVDVPAGEELLAETLQQPVPRVRQALERLSAQYAEAERGIDLRRVGDGWRFYTREKFAPYVERYLLDGQRTKLTRAALETLAVIAYRQPVTRARVAAVRGVNVDGVIRTLVGRGLIEEAGTDPETGGILYCTTELFLERLGLSSLKDLPPLAPLLPEVDSIDDV